MNNVKPGWRSCGEKAAETELIWGLSGENCRNLSQLSDPNPSCSKNCNDECDSFLVSFTYSPTHVPMEFFNTTVTEVLVKNFCYPYTEEHEIISWSTFLTQLGGSLSCYLGINFLALVHMLNFFIRLFLPTTIFSSAHSSLSLSVSFQALTQWCK